MKKLANETRVRFVPGIRHPDKSEHTGSVIYFTTDCFYRIQWDDPNPDPDFFNLGTVFLQEQLQEI